ncbi:CHAP domain-containing protein (plasmid) [Leifsonia sp. ZF2019]|uniref:aggregation-promoting factor C-terminal-like domain-containing protein n=1 Tax=Leifsonia sp. ZF2019 TaxID=2781978 RepID=UPI001CBE08B4|nr:CHAP domain-containing protein [Leifsonia sp. ZF2019]UAJ81705.1 CHAP domain-containing protein [Leifsonia sp. ZF2019]
MRDLRRQDTGSNATDHLGRLSLARRSQRLIGDTAASSAGKPRALLTAIRGAAKGAGKTVKHGANAATAGYRASQEDQDLQERTHRRPSAPRGVGQRLLPKATGAKNLVTGTRDGRAAIRTQRHGSGLVRGGIIAGRKRAKGVASARSVGVSASRTAAAASRAAAAAANTVRAIVAALTSALSSAPVLLITAIVVVAVMAVLVAVAWLLPGAQQVQAEQSAGTNLAGSFGLVDDYPYKGKYSEDAMSPLGYAYGNCTDFVAWRINRDAGVSTAPWKLTWKDLTPHGGNGADWGNLGNLPGWDYTRTPVPGDVISIKRAGVLGSSTSNIGHVGYVGAVDGAGTVTIENYGRGRYFLTTVSVAQLGAYIDDGALAIKHNPAGRIGGVPNGDANGDAKAYALQALGGDTNQFDCLNNLWMGESGWNPHAQNPSSGAYGIPQALPAEKLASAGADWRDNPITQVKWGLGYIQGRYGTPCQAWHFWQLNSPHWY